jgi:hypothetical protein
MLKLSFTTFVLLLFSLLQAQHSILVFKKKNKSINKYWQGSSFSFQLSNKQWQKGDIIKIQNDSFYIRPAVMQFGLYGTDTVNYPIAGFSLKDVYAIPKKGVQIDYKDGSFQIATWAGHQHFYWVKSGWIFRVGAAGYAALNILNGLIKEDLSFSNNGTQLAIAAAVFVGGVLMHKMYKVTIRTGRKYHLEMLTISD